jgi:hypothetical protein
MNPPTKFARIIGRKRYDVSTATLLAGNDYWDGHNFERAGRNTFLYRTPNGNYFKVCLSQWVNESNILLPLAQDEAIELYENCLTEHELSYAEAFPGVTVVDA